MPTNPGSLAARWAAHQSKAEQMTNRTQTRAATVTILYILDQTGALAGLSQAEIARRLNLPNRSKVSRSMADVRALRDIIPDMLHDFELRAAQDLLERPESGASGTIGGV